MTAKMETAYLVYEWEVEEWMTDESGVSQEVIDIEHYGADTFVDAVALRDRFAKNLKPGHSLHVILVRDDTRLGCDKSWAYLKDGKLPVFFAEPDINGIYQPNGIKVPQRFHAEVAR